MNVTLCPDKKGQGPKAHLSPSKVPVLVERKQISVGSSFRSRFPRPALLSSLREPGTQLNWPSVSSAAQMGRPGPTNCDSYGRPLLLGHRDRGEGEVHRCLKGWTKASGGLVRPLEPCGMEPQSVPWALHSPTARRLGNLEGLPEKAWVCLLPHSPLGDQDPTDPWLNRFPSGPSLTVTSRQGPLWCWPTVEQDN